MYALIRVHCAMPAVVAAVAGAVAVAGRFLDRGLDRARAGLVYRAEEPAWLCIIRFTAQAGRRLRPGAVPTELQTGADRYRLQRCGERRSV